MIDAAPPRAAAGDAAPLLGLVQGFVGVAIFSLTLPFTRLAVAELSPWLVAFGRMAIAGLLGAMLLAVLREPLPQRRDWPALAGVAVGVVLGFPLLTSLALRTVDSSHGAVVLAVLPLVTAMAAVLLGGERPTRRFWIWAVAGTAIVVAFTVARSGGAPGAGDMLLLAACCLAAIGYALGAGLSRASSGLVVIAWALVLALPVTLPTAAILTVADPPAAHLPAWLGFAYVSVMSQLVGFLFWYRGLALGGTARVGQVQLVQVFLTLVASAALLGERLDLLTLGCGTLTAAVVWRGTRARAVIPPKGSAQAAGGSR